MGKSRMKGKLVTLLALFLAVLFVLCGCGPEKPNNNDPDDDKKPSGEYTLPLEDGYNQLTIYYSREAGYDDCDIWMWYSGADGRGYLMHECTYGAKVVINIPEGVSEVGFIIRTGCSEPGGTSWGTATKDGTEADRSVAIKTRETVIYTKAGDAKSYTSDDGGLTLKEMRNIDMADMQDPTHIKYILSTAASVTAADVTLKDSAGNTVAISKVTSSNSNGTIETAQPLDLATAYTLAIATFDDPVPVVPLTYFSSKEFGEAYNYDGALGVELSAASTTFRLWAPTASKVTLNLFNAGDGGNAYKTIDLTRGEKGVWSHTESENLNGKYYTYTVSTSAGVQEAVDPYAVSAGLNGNRGMILDLDSTDPTGWTNTPYDPAGVTNYTDAEIWEIHVRDFSNTITDSKLPANERGKFLAFTRTGLTNKNGIPVGLDYLKALGITHVHLLPSYDYATVDESKTDGFNWGYDPKNYNVPEGSYSTNPSDGAVRVNEFKQMVQALHNNGIGVIMDVVYNHTSGLDSNLNKIVPYYYYRYNSNGTPSNGSGCGNETASERYMFRKYMVDSVNYWQTEYNVDGFRFDLMGLHDVTTMQAIESKVHENNPKALIYGEGWTGGGSTLSTSNQSVLANIQKVNANTKTNGIAMFSDVIRDGIKGSVFDINDVGFATGAKAGAAGNILFGVNGGVKNTSLGTTNSNNWWTYNPTNVVNYASAHDNNTLWDRICHVYGEGADTLEMRLKRNRLSAAIVQTSLGIPFMQAGEEMLRQKKNADGSYNENSYNASDAVNNLKWDLLSETSEEYKMMQYYKGLIEFRKSSEILRLAVASDRGVNVCTKVKVEGALIAFTMTNPYNPQEQLFIVYNATESAKTLELPAGNWNLHVNGERAGAGVISGNLSGSQQIAAVSCYVYSKI